MELPSITRRQERDIKKFFRVKEPKPGEEVQAGELGGSLLHILKLPWYFEKAYEKIILILISYLGVWKIWDLIKAWI